MICYATKIWEGEWEDTLDRHREADLFVGDNLLPSTAVKLEELLGYKFVDIGSTDDPYFVPELCAIALTRGADYILWYASDVIPPKTDWVREALPLLDLYPIVTCRSFGENIDLGRDLPDIKLTDWGWESYFFSDQCYLAKVTTMQSVDYTATHEIAKRYPDHGGNSFERRVAQWLALNQMPMAHLKNHRYWHLDKRDK